MDNLQADGLFREYNKHVALRYVQWNLTKIADSARREYLLNIMYIEHYKVHSPINYHRYYGRFYGIQYIYSLKSFCCIFLLQRINIFLY